jgi:hypothetical protein
VAGAAATCTGKQRGEVAHPETKPEEEERRGRGSSLVTPEWRAGAMGSSAQQGKMEEKGGGGGGVLIGTGAREGSRWGIGAGASSAMWREQAAASDARRWDTPWRAQTRVGKLTSGPRGGKSI